MNNMKDNILVALSSIFSFLIGEFIHNPIGFAGAVGMLYALFMMLEKYYSFKIKKRQNKEEEES